MEAFVSFVIFGLTIGVVYGIVALGISLIYTGLDIVHFAHGEIYMFGAFFGLVFAERVGVPYWLAILSAMLVTGLLGIVIERVFYRRLTRAGGGYTVGKAGAAETVEVASAELGAKQSCRAVVFEMPWRAARNANAFTQRFTERLVFVDEQLGGPQALDFCLQRLDVGHFR